MVFDHSAMAALAIQEPKPISSPEFDAKPDTRISLERSLRYALFVS